MANRFSQWGLLGSLYTAQFIPNMFFTVALPVYLRSRGASLETVSLLSLLFLPWCFKFLWSPLVDRYGYTRWGHYRAWIFGTQSVAAALIAICAWFNVQAHLGNLVGWMLLITFFCATQDIATDALAVGMLPVCDREVGNGIQSMGGYLGSIIGAGVMLILLDRWTWTPTMLMLAVVMVLSMIPLLTVQEQVHPANVARTNLWRYYGQQFWTFYQRPGMKSWLLLVLLYAMSGVMGHTMLRPLMVDLGLSLSRVGWLLGMIGYGAGMGGAIASIPLVRHLSRKQALSVIAILQGLVLLGCLLPALGFQQTVAPVVVLFHVGLGFVSTIMHTTFMDRTAPATAGFDYSFQSSVSFIGGVGAAAISGLLVTHMGYPLFFGLCSLLSLLSIAVIHGCLGNIEPQSPILNPAEVASGPR
ncbi:MFS transporter [Acaryochloris marina NIES-2412]|uniref:MFS transporter n=1 Tax=Acaryochloris marina TaxID=155978 RepID=UPI004058BEB4